MSPWRFLVTIALACAAGGHALAQAPESGDAARAHELGVALFAAARNDAQARAAAIRSLEEAVALAPGELRYVLDLADAYLRSGTDVGAVLAIDLYEEQLKADPRNDPLRARLAEAYAAVGNFDAALDYAASRLAGAGAPNPQAMGQVAKLAALGGQTERAIGLLEIALRRAPNDNATRLVLAALLAAEGQQKRAQDFADSVAAGEPAGSRLAIEAGRLGAELRRGGGK